jgi:phosphoadenosine phosphosulfate reductase
MRPVPFLIVPVHQTGEAVIAAKVFEKRIGTAFEPSADPEALATSFPHASLRPHLNDRVAAIRRIVSGRVVFTTSFGIEDQAIAHAIFSQGLAIDVVTLDTGRLFPETFELWARTENRYRQRILAAYPDRVGVEPLVGLQGINGFYASVEARHACCAVRKVEPLRRALAGAVAWITGLRADQSDVRVGASFAIVAPRHRLIKVNPLFDWSREQVLAFIRENDIPYHTLHDRGFSSIGCAPCTRAVAPGEPERAGRWWWEQEQTNERAPDDCHGPQAPASPQSTSSPQEATP